MERFHCILNLFNNSKLSHQFSHGALHNNMLASSDVCTCMAVLPVFSAGVCIWPVDDQGGIQEPIHVQ